MSTDLRIPHWKEIKDTLTGKRAFVHAEMEVHAPCTAKQLSVLIGWDKCSVRPRFSELLHAGLIEETGKREDGEHVFAFISLEEAERRARVADQIEFDSAQSFTLSPE